MVNFDDHRLSRGNLNKGLSVVDSYKLLKEESDLGCVQCLNLEKTKPALRGFPSMRGFWNISLRSCTTWFHAKN
nr:hypothetical protein [Tanacetum cinerariifolium]